MEVSKFRFCRLFCSAAVPKCTRLQPQPDQVHPPAHRQPTSTQMHTAGLSVAGLGVWGRWACSSRSGASGADASSPASGSFGAAVRACAPAAPREHTIFTCRTTAMHFGGASRPVSHPGESGSGALGIPPMPALACFTSSLSHGGELWTVVGPIDAGHVTQGQGVPDQRVLPISGAQHVQAVCHLSGVHHQGLGKIHSEGV